jgi:hypothetical protein
MFFLVPERSSAEEQRKNSPQAAGSNPVRSDQVKIKQARDLRVGDAFRGGIVTLVEPAKHAVAGMLVVQFSYPYSPAGVREVLVYPTETIS